MAEKKQKDAKEMTNKELFKLMAGPSQLKRKNAAKVLTERVKAKPEDFKKNIPDFVDALSRPEAQTRWLALECLTFLVPQDAKACKAAIEGAEEALFDEKTALIRESAVRFLSRYGASSMQRSKEVWPLIKEALQQFHGEIEYDKILNRINFFAAGKLDANVKKDLRATARDIQKSVGGPTKQRLERILLSTQGKTLKVKPKKVAAKKSTAKKPVKKTSSSKKSVAKKPSPKKKVESKKKDVKKKVESKKKDVKKKVVKKAVKTAVAKPKAKTKVGKKAEKKKKQAAKKVVKKAVKKTIKSKVKSTVKKAVKKQPKKSASKKAAKKK